MRIRLLLMDVDGTLTDGKIYIGADGKAFKSFHVRDGLGIKEILPAHGIVPVVITGRRSEITRVRMSELGVEHIYQDVSDKLGLLRTLAEKFGVQPGELAYIGDDVNDLGPIHACGYTACPSDAVPEIRDTVDYVCACKGGEGAVREFIEAIIRRQKKRTPIGAQ